MHYIEYQNISAILRSDYLSIRRKQIRKENFFKFLKQAP